MIDILLFLFVLFSPFLLAFFAVLVCMAFGIGPTVGVHRIERRKQK